MEPSTKYSTLFDNQSDIYAASRPTYPRELYDAIVGFGRETHDTPSSESFLFKSCVDVGAGSGQATVDLAKICQKVLAIDLNENQLKHAIPIENVTYAKGSAENIPADDGSVDLITVAQAAHWFDLEKFYQESSRVLAPGGIIAVWGYGLNELENQEANEILKEFYSVTLAPYWADRRKMLDDEYTGIIIPFSANKRLNLFMEKQMPMSHFIHYLRSWSATTSYIKENPDPLPGITTKIAEAYQISTEDTILVRWPIYLVLSHKPSA